MLLLNPSYPYSLEPHVYSYPLMSINDEWDLPADIDETVIFLSIMTLEG
jgi:hypothetical protein